MKVKSLCVLRKPVAEQQISKENNGTKTKQKCRLYPQPSLVCGVSLRKTNLSNMDIDNMTVDEKSEVQIMNKVNEVVSGEEPPRIIPADDVELDDEEDYFSCHDEMLQATTFVPHILLLAAQDDTRTSSKNKDKDKIQTADLPTHISSNVSYINVPSMGMGGSKHGLMANMDPMLDSDLDMDADVQIVGVTPGFMNGAHNGTINISSVDGTPMPPDLKETSSSISFKSTTSNVVTEETQPKQALSGKVRAGSVLQCVELPLELQLDAFCISCISPTLDGHHLVVVVSPSTDLVVSPSTDHCSFSKSNNVISQPCSMDIGSDSSADIDSNAPSQSQSQVFDTRIEPEQKQSNITSSDTVDTQENNVFGCLLVYSYRYDEEYAVIDEKPIVVRYINSPEHVIRDILVLPHDVCDYHDEDEDHHLVKHVDNDLSSTVPKSSESNKLVPNINGQIATTLVNGTIWILNLCDFNRVGEITPPPGDLFVSATYCIGKF